MLTIVTETLLFLTHQEGICTRKTALMTFQPRIMTFTPRCLPSGRTQSVLLAATAITQLASATALPDTRGEAAVVPLVLTSAVVMASACSTRRSACMRTIRSISTTANFGTKVVRNNVSVIAASPVSIAANAFVPTVIIRLHPVKRVLPTTFSLCTCRPTKMTSSP